jgi:hypothetical protein
MLTSTNRVLIPALDTIGVDADELALNFNEHGEFEIRTLTFPSIGTLRGQEAFIDRLLNTVDPAACTLRTLGYPKRQRFGAKSILAE